MTDEERKERAHAMLDRVLEARSAVVKALGQFNDARRALWELIALPKGK